MARRPMWCLHLLLLASNVLCLTAFNQGHPVGTATRQQPLTTRRVFGVGQPPPALSAQDDPVFELPLFDPKGDEIPFPYPCESGLEANRLSYRFGASAALTAMASAVRKQPLTDVLKSPSFGHVAVKKPIAPLSSAASGGSDEAEVQHPLVGAIGVVCEMVDRGNGARLGTGSQGLELEQEQQQLLFGQSELDQQGISPSEFLEEAREITERIKQQRREQGDYNRRNDEALGPFGDDGGTGVGALFAGSGPGSSGLPGWSDGDDEEDDDDFLGWSSGISKSAFREDINRANVANAAAAAARDGSSRQDKGVGKDNDNNNNEDNANEKMRFENADNGSERARDDMAIKNLFETGFGNGDLSPSSSSGSFRKPSQDDESVLVVTPSFRFEVLEVVRTIPYVVAKVKRLRDDDDAAPTSSPAAAAPAPAAEDGGAEDDEVEKSAHAVMQAVKDLVTMSRTLEESGGREGSSLSANYELDRVAKRMDAWMAQQVDDDVPWNTPGLRAQRMESLGFLVADLLPLPVSQAEAILATTNAVERFQLLLSFLEPARAEIAAMKALDSLGRGGGSAASGTKSPNQQQQRPQQQQQWSGRDSMGLSVGLRIEYWYNEEWGWFAGTLVDQLRTSLAGEEVVLWTLRYDDYRDPEDNRIVKGYEERLKLNLENKPRWRILRSRD